MNGLQVFNYQSEQVRTVADGDSVLFVAKDVCAILNVDSTQVRRLDDDEKGMRKIQTPGGEQELTVITEGGLYTLIIRSNKPEAKPFRKWVTSEVLPAIRKAGSFSLETPEIQIARALITAATIIEEKNKLIEDMTPKAAFFDAVTDSKTAVDMAIVAKTLDMGIGRNQLFEFLRDEGILDRRNIPYQTYCDRGYFRVVESQYNKPDGTACVSFKTLVFQKGMDYIRRKYNERGSK